MIKIHAQKNLALKNLMDVQIPMETKSQITKTIVQKNLVPK